MPLPTKLVFFGTGPVSLATLEGLKKAFEFEAIITKPAAVSPHGRLHPAPVRMWAELHKIPVFQPEDKAALSKLFKTKDFDSQLGLVVDYGLIIPADVIDYFPLGIVNSHFSLLPTYRGADPITAAILNGDSRSGVTIMLIVPALDEGPVLGVESFSIPDDFTTPQLTDALVALSNKLIQDIIPRYISGSIKPHEQNQDLEISYTNKLQKSDGSIDWNKPAVRLEHEIRAYLGWPGSTTRLFDRDITVTRAHTEPGKLKPGELSSDKKSLTVGTAQDLLVIDRLKPTGKRDMSTQEFLAGLRLL